MNRIKSELLGSGKNLLPFFFFKHHTNYFAVCLTLNAWHRSSVDIHRRSNARMAHQLLLHFEWSARSIEPRTIKMLLGAFGGRFEHRQVGAELT